jgi:signal transduction histidine kinase
VGPRRFWIANANGLYEFDPVSNEAKIIPELAGDHVRCIHKCKDGSILLGTYGQGYYYYHHERFFRMPLDKNGFLITAHCFLEDKHQNVWITCNKGLFKVPKADMDSWCDSPGSQIYYYYYGRQDGLKTNEFNGGYNAPGLITEDGFIALLSMKGLVYFNVDSLRSDFPRGRIDITNVEIDGKAGDKANTIELPPDYNSLVLEVSCPFLGNRNNLYLEYSLKGLNDEWKAVPEDGIINLSRLGAGNYTLRIRKVNGFGKNNYLFRECSIIVVPHFYKTTWFSTVAALALLLLLALLVQLWWKLREKRKEVRIKAEKLEVIVAEQEKTVEKLEESQKALLQTSKVREKLISLVIHDLRSPLRFLTMLSSGLHDNQASLSPEEIKERTYWIKKGTQDIYNFSEDFLLWVTSQKNNFSITRRLFPIRPLLQEIQDFFREQVQQKGNSILFDAEEDLNIHSDPHILITIIRNLVDNANKYTDRGKIMISAYAENGHIVIAVADTGKGMSPRQMEQFLRNDSLDDLKSGTQLGHKFIFDLTRRIDGAVSIESTERVGTTVRLKFNRE